MKIPNLLKDKRILLLIIVVTASILLIAFKGLQFGIDLSGGTIIVLKADKPMNDKEIEATIRIITERLNYNGLNDVIIYPRGNDEIVVEIPKSCDTDRIIKILKQQGVFVAKIDNITAYTGSDVQNVELPQKIPEGNNWAYGVPFELTLDGAKKFAEVAKGKAYHKVYLYMDGKLISAPVLSPDLADGKPHPKQVITVGSYPPTKEEIDEAMAIYSALKSGALPVKLNIEYMSTISPEFGKDFLKGTAIALLLAFIAVGTIISIRYKQPKIAIPILITCISEVIIILGFASLIGWKLDLPSIAGIIAAVGTGVDNQIVITDEALKKGAGKIRASIKRAFFIIFASASTSIAAMLPLFVLGVGMLKGFAITTIAGVLIGIFITRPAFARIIEEMFKKF
ncbi:SecD/SecF/SecDF export membrane protein [Methanocaldococcus vulcanius M7]|uniref:Protein-export membrane protein SecD n=1 Tax=Methanocaldococcus vulcanius (strain ATCC 700851 / DSM 12094 / M7) TaxID=579137 RepID=C9RHB5_METVM|nr:preprotein translocase subunit SecD [Methanocaldococcus vulcanius]ACX72967.1 SecD/SecF/SecDF export membrane protein [Methanocaldococcus vulcanius M7]